MRANTKSGYTLVPSYSLLSLSISTGKNRYPFLSLDNDLLDKVPFMNIISLHFLTCEKSYSSIQGIKRMNIGSTFILLHKKPKFSFIFHLLTVVTYWIILMDRLKISFCSADKMYFKVKIERLIELGSRCVSGSA